MTGDKINKETMCMGHMSDIEVARIVRMLMRTDMDHEAVCVASRDRIMYLSQRVEYLEKILNNNNISFEKQ